MADDNRLPTNQSQLDIADKLQAIATAIINKVASAVGVTFDDTNVSYTANNVQSAIESASTADGTEYSSGVSVKQKIDELAGSATTLLLQQQLTLTETSYLLSDEISKYRFIIFAVSWVGGIYSNYLFTIGGAIAGSRLYLNNITTGEYGQIVGFTDSTHVTAFASNTNVYISVFGVK